MMFPKPQRKEKEKKPYNSLQQRGSKPKKEVAEWRKGILSHHESKPSRTDRAEFPRQIIEELIRETDGLCQCCGRLTADTTHHVRPRGRGGRGVKSNAMRLNWNCHDRIQTNEEELQYWMSEWERKFGENFWFDAQDWEEHDRKQAIIRNAEKEKSSRTERLEPIVNLLAGATGRSLKVKEMRFLENMDEKEFAVFAQLMQDVVSVEQVNVPQFGYGYFND